MKSLGFDKESLKVFFTGFLQVSLVSCNTYQIAHKEWVGIFIVGFLISLVWCFNVRRAALGSTKDRIFYCCGAAIGSIVGCAGADFYYNHISHIFNI